MCYKGTWYTINDVPSWDVNKYCLDGFQSLRDVRWCVLPTLPGLDHEADGRDDIDAPLSHLLQWHQSINFQVRSLVRNPIR